MKSDSFSCYTKYFLIFRDSILSVYYTGLFKTNTAYLTSNPPLIIKASLLSIHYYLITIIYPHFLYYYLSTIKLKVRRDAM